MDSVRKTKLAEILDSAAMVGNKLPDIFWELDITGKELRVLRFVWSNVTRLYEMLKNPPHNKEDKTPRYWNGKEKMADTCNVSYPMFRNSIRHLSKMGIVTSMDAKYEFDDAKNCVGLKLDFFEGLGIKFEPELDRNSEKYSFHLVEDVIPYLYDQNTYEIVKEKTIEVEGLKTEVAAYVALKNPPQKEFLGTRTVTHPDGTVEEQEVYGYRECPRGYKAGIISEDSFHYYNSKIDHVPVVIEKVLEKKVEKKGWFHKALPRLLEVRDETGAVHSIEQEILDLGKYYNYKVSHVIGTTGYRCLPFKGFREKKNWKFLKRIHETCTTRQWDYKVYFDAQFERASHWKAEGCKGYPYLNQCVGEKAEEYYEKYYRDYQEKFSVTGEKIKVKTVVPQSYVQDVADAIIKDCDRFLYFVKSHKKRPAFKERSLEEMKYFWLTHYTVSPYYWAAIDWGVSYLQNLSNDPSSLKLIEEVVKIQKSRAMLSVVLKVVQEVEKTLKIPSKAVQYDHFRSL